MYVQGDVQSEMRMKNSIYTLKEKNTTLSYVLCSVLLFFLEKLLRNIKYCYLGDTSERLFSYIRSEGYNKHFRVVSAYNGIDCVCLLNFCGYVTSLQFFWHQLEDLKWEDCREHYILMQTVLTSV